MAFFILGDIMADDATATIETDIPEASSSHGIDIEAASDKIGNDLFPEMLEKEPNPTPVETVAQAIAAPAETTTPMKEIAPLPTVRQAPKSWAKDVHPIWEKIDPKAQEYIEKREKDFLDGLEQYKGAATFARSIQDVLTPYQGLLQSKGLDAPRAIDDMLGAYSRLTQGTVEQRQSALLQVAKNLGIPVPGMQATDPAASPVDPRIQTLEQQFQEIRDAQVRQQQLALQAAQEKANAEVNTFASDPKNAFFDECHEDIVKFIKAGDSLQEAYDKAVWANPVTREKQKQAYFQTESEKAKERARLDALPKQKARGVNVKSQDTQRPPTDPLGSMEDTLRSTLKTIKERTTH